jgi:hypothetical protein
VSIADKRKSYQTRDATAPPLDALFVDLYSGRTHRRFLSSPIVYPDLLECGAMKPLDASRDGFLFGVATRLATHKLAINCPRRNMWYGKQVVLAAGF